MPELERGVVVTITKEQERPHLCHDCGGDIPLADVVMESRSVAGGYWGESRAEVPVHADRRICIANKAKR